MSSVSWQDYEQNVTDIAGDLMASLVDQVGSVRTKRDAAIAGRNGPHRIDVLAEDGKNALFIECKNHQRVLTKDAVSATLYNFLDVCLGNPHLRWSLAIVSASDIPDRARLPASRPNGIYAPPTNLAQGTLSRSCFFVYFSPPRSPELSAPFLLREHGRVDLVATADNLDSDVDTLQAAVDDAALPLLTRVGAGFRIAALQPDALTRDARSARTLIHGLLHLGLVQDAFYIHHLLNAQRRGDTQDQVAQIDELMMRFQLARRRYINRRTAGDICIKKLSKMFNNAPITQKVSIATFAGPVLAQRGDASGLEMLATVEQGSRRLDTPDASYYEILRLVRTAQVVRDLGLRKDFVEKGLSGSLCI